MKTIQELNSKWYWRLLKVIYLLLAVTILIYSVAFLFNFIHVYNPKEINTISSNVETNSNIQKELIECNYASIANATEYKIEEICGQSWVQKYYIDDYFRTKAIISTVFTAESWNIESYYNLTWSVDNDFRKIFGIRPTEYRWIIEYIKILGYLVLIWIWLSIVTFLLTRVIYYIILWKFNPEK